MKIRNIDQQDIKLEDIDSKCQRGSYLNGKMNSKMGQLTHYNAHTH